jgi:hypothetical protein
MTYFEKGNVFGLIVAFITFVSSWIYCIASRITKRYRGGKTFSSGLRSNS